MASVVVATAYGAPEVLSVVYRPVGVPGPGEARVAVRAVGVNPIDYKMYSGAFGADPAKLPMPLGFEMSGVVAEVGKDAIGPVGAIKAGDEIIGYRVTGAYASDLIAPAQALVPKPANLDWAQAAGLMLTGVTSWHCLAATNVGPGDTVLMHGAAGGVGVMAVQLAVGRGATVIGTAGPGGHSFLRELGAIPVAYGPGLADRVREVAPGGVDASLDLVGTEEAIDVSLELVPDRARIVTIASPGRTGQVGIKAVGGAPGADPGTEIRAAARIELAKLAAAGSLRVFVSQTFPLTAAADAHRAISAGHTQGKIALIP